MNTRLLNTSATLFLQLKKAYPRLFMGVQLLLLSWFYALCEQIALPLPFGLVPMIFMPVPLYALAFMVGMPALYAYGLYIVQGALGAPFFAHGLGGIARLLGPTGGYLIGMGAGALFIAGMRSVRKSSTLFNLFLIESANVILFATGVYQLSFFVPSSQLLVSGVWPFMFGDVVVKAGMVISVTVLYRFYKKRRVLPQ